MLRRATVPARVNIIGEHTDYCGGLSLPFAIDSYLVLNAERNLKEFIGDDEIISLWKETGGWPAKLTVESEIPIGKGLSSSAALCLAIVLCAHGKMDPLDASKEAQRIEHKILKTKCGLLDQMAIMNAIKNHATLIDFSNHSIKHHIIPEDWKFKLVDSGIKRNLNSTQYNKKNNNIKSHILKENLRVEKAINSSAKELGILLNESHSSLQRLGVSLPKIDEKVASLQKTKGVLGARLMGGGFGGMILTIVENEDVLSEKLVKSSGPAILEEFF